VFVLINPNSFIFLFLGFWLPSPQREVVGGKPARTEADVPLLQKSDRRKLFLQLCEHTAYGCGLVAGDRRRSRHAQIKIMIL